MVDDQAQERRRRRQARGALRQVVQGDQRRGARGWRRRRDEPHARPRRAKGEGCQHAQRQHPARHRQGNRRRLRRRRLRANHLRGLRARWGRRPSRRAYGQPQQGRLRRALRLLQERRQAGHQRLGGIPLRAEGRHPGPQRLHRRGRVDGGGPRSRGRGRRGAGERLQGRHDPGGFHGRQGGPRRGGYQLRERGDHHGAPEQHRPRRGDGEADAAPDRRPRRERRRAGSLRELRYLRGSHGGGSFVRRAAFAGALCGRAGRGPCIKKILVSLLAPFLVSSACSSADEKGGEGDVIAGASEQRTTDLAPTQVEAEGGIGDRVEAGDLRFRIFEVRANDRIYAMSGPGKNPVTRGNISSEYVAIDYLAKNISGSPLTTRAKATLLDDQGNSYWQDKSIEPPSGGTDSMELGTAQTKASTIFFEVPNGIIPSTLQIKASDDEVRFDLLEGDMERVPPEDYLRVYHLYFNERAYEEAYEMFDPASVQNITLGEWMSFYEPLWGKRYVSLNNLTPISEGSGRAVFQMTRTFYDAEGD